MKSVFRSLLLIVISTLLLSSCSMQKRTYMPGYTIVWHNTHHSSQSGIPAKEISIKENTADTTSATADKSLAVHTINSETILERKKKIDYPSNSMISTFKEIKIASKIVKPVLKNKQKKLSKASDGASFNPLALAALACLLLTIVTAFFVPGVSVFFYLGSIILSIIAIKQIRDNDDGGIGLAIAVLVIDILSIVIGIGILLLVLGI